LVILSVIAHAIVYWDGWDWIRSSMSKNSNTYLPNDKSVTLLGEPERRPWVPLLRLLEHSLQTQQQFPHGMELVPVWQPVSCRLRSLLPPSVCKTAREPSALASSSSTRPNMTGAPITIRISFSFPGNITCKDGNRFDAPYVAGAHLWARRRGTRKPCPGKLHCRNKVVIESRTTGAFVVCYKVLGKQMTSMRFWQLFKYWLTKYIYCIHVHVDVSGDTWQRDYMLLSVIRWCILSIYFSLHG
jgi:hypothetical protein